MKKSHSILFPKSVGVPIFLFTYATGMRRVISLKEAKDIVLGAILRGDMVVLDKDVSEFIAATGETVTVVDKAEVERAQAKYKAEVSE